MAEQELKALSPSPGDQTPVDLEVIDVSVFIKRLKTREFFGLIRVITTGAPMLLANLKFSDEPDAFAAQLAGAFFFALPEAEDEALNFVRSLISFEGLSDEETEKVEQEFENPDLLSVTQIIEKLVEQEGEDIQALGKRLGRMFNIAEKTGQTKPRKKSQSSEGSQEPSTSSPASMDGETTTSSSSTSPDSDRSSQPSESVGA